MILIIYLYPLFHIIQFQNFDTKRISPTAPNIAGTYVVNIPPVLDNIGNKNVTEDVELSFILNGSDFELSNLTYSIDNLPSGASFIIDTFTWTPDFTQSGIYEITFNISDGLGTDTETINITVINDDTTTPTGSVVIDLSGIEEGLNMFVLALIYFVFLLIGFLTKRGSLVMIASILGLVIFLISSYENLIKALGIGFNLLVMFIGYLMVRKQ